MLFFCGITFFRPHQEEAAKRKDAAAAAVAGPITAKRPARRMSKLMPTVGGAAADSSRMGWGKANGIDDSEGCASGLGNLKGMTKLSTEAEEPKTLGGRKSNIRGFMKNVNIPSSKGIGKVNKKKTARLTLGRPGGAFGGARRGRGRGRGIRR